MTYVYDILVNFNDELYNFYEWEETDAIEYLKKSLLIKTNDFIFKKFVSSNIEVDEEFLSMIKNKTEVSNGNIKEIIKYCTIITNGKSVMAFTFNGDGAIIEKSSFILEDELELLEIASDLKIKKITYKKLLNKDVNHTFLTREEKKKMHLILVELDSIKEEKEKIKYLYYEWFNKRPKSKNYYELLVSSINGNYTKKHEEFLCLLNMMMVRE